ADQHFDSSLNPLSFREDLMTNPAHAAAWLFRVVRDDVEGPHKYEAKTPRELWNALAEKDTEFLEGIWRLVFDTSVKNFADYPIIRIAALEVHVLSCAGWLDLASYKQDAEIRRYLPDTNKEWR